MSETALSPTFAGARKLSRVLAILFTVAFWFMLFVLATVPVTAVLPPSNIGLGLGHGVRIPLGSLSSWPRVAGVAAAFLMLVPTVMMLHHGRKLFACFARGEVFAANPIAHIRWAGLWLIAYFFTGIAAVFLMKLVGVHNDGRIVALVPTLLDFQGTLVTGIATTIAAYVMEEARRIAADNANII